jgi:hypothetical protein
MINIKNNQKAQSHVEIIFSFVIFISFLSFLLLFFNPFKTVSQTETYLNLAQAQIEKMVTKEVKLLTFNSDSELSGCHSFDYGYLGGENIVTKNSSGHIFKSSHEQLSDKYRIRIDFSDLNQFYLIYFSEDFEENYEPGSCGTISSGDYSLGLLRTYNVVSFKKITGEFSARYNEDYANLKNEIGIPQTKDFSLSFYDLTRQTIFILGKSPEKVIVYARDIPVQLIYPDGRFEYGFMNIKIW